MVDKTLTTIEQELKDLQQLENYFFQRLENVRKQISYKQEELEQVKKQIHLEEVKRLELLKEETKQQYLARRGETIFLNETSLRHNTRIMHYLCMNDVHTVEQLEFAKGDIKRFRRLGEKSIEIIMHFMENLEEETEIVIQNRQKIQEENHEVEKIRTRKLKNAKTLEDLYNQMYRTEYYRIYSGDPYIKHYKKYVEQYIK